MQSQRIEDHRARVEALCNLGSLKDAPLIASVRIRVRFVSGGRLGEEVESHAPDGCLNRWRLAALAQELSVCLQLMHESGKEAPSGRIARQLECHVHGEHAKLMGDNGRGRGELQRTVQVRAHHAEGRGERRQHFTEHSGWPTSFLQYVCVCTEL
jgi:hypothetical protein